MPTQELQQRQILSQQQLQALNILSLDGAALDEMLKKEEIDNPLFDLDKIHGTVERPISVQTPDKEGDLSERAAPDKTAQDLYLFLESQLPANATKAERGVFRHMVEFLEPGTGLLPETVEEVAEILAAPLYVVERCLSWLHQMEPAGVGARDLSECLVLQLSRRKDNVPYAMDIAARFLTELSRSHYGPITKALGASISEIQAAEKAIAALDPHPGQAFQPAEPTLYVRPDVFIVELEGELQVLLNEYYLPKVTVNPYYSSMAKESDDPEARTYLKEKLRQTKWLLDSLERRGSTLRRCAQAILDAQRSFFSGQTVELSPMKLSSLAETLDLHPSTVSRAVRDKYLQCRQGIYPLRYFFSRAVGQQGLSRQAVKQRMLLRFKDEDSSHPLSDQALCDLLAEEGIFLARRTVAKYRIELGIGSSTARRARNRGK